MLKAVSIYFIKRKIQTFFAAGTAVRRLGAVAGETAALLDAASTVVAQAAGAAAVTGTTRTNTRSQLCALLQVIGHAVNDQRSDAAQETSLTGQCPT